MASILKSVQDIFATHGEQPTYWLALSGGLDSQVLVHASYEISKVMPIKLRILHVNHGISPHAPMWQLQCEKTSAQYGLPFKTVTLPAGIATKKNVEAVLRKARYQVFANTMQAGDILLTAHHQDDQAETLLLQLCRGAGPKGLAAMPLIKTFASGLHARPLLTISKKKLEEYAETNELMWIEDEMNKDTQLSRNFIRHHILPLLSNRWPSIARTLSRTARHCAEHDSVLSVFTEAELKSCYGTKPNTLSVNALLLKSSEKQRLLIRAWLIEQGIALPNTKKLLSIQQNLLTAKSDRYPLVTWQQYEMRRFQSDLYVLNPFPIIINKEPMLWHVDAHLMVPGLGELAMVKKRGAGLSIKLPAVTVRFRKGGERIHLGKRGHKTLKNLFQEWGVAPWLRDRIPLLYDGERLINVVGYCLDPAYAVLRQDEDGHEVRINSTSF